MAHQENEAITKRGFWKSRSPWPGVVDKNQMIRTERVG